MDQKVYTCSVEEAVYKRYSKKRIKLLEEKTKLSVYVIGKIIFDKRWDSFNLAGEFQNWIQKGDLNDVVDWIRSNYDRLSIDGLIDPPYDYNKTLKEQ
jgi:hypothetical protein